MKQVIEQYRTGKILVPEVPAPACRPGSVLVHTQASLISAGTEGAAIRFGQQSLLQKARSRPDLVRQVINKIRTEGIWSTYRVAQARLEAPLALGYSSAGIVLEVGAGVSGLKPGDRVACGGGGHASHAEIVTIPRNLIIPIPEGVDYVEAAFATVGAVALQGIRVADVRVGERVMVIGLGLIGLLTVQLLKASGCLVIGADPNPARVALARDLGANEAVVMGQGDILATMHGFTAGRGTDAVIIAAATKSNEPIELAAACSRLKGRVVAVGDVRLDVPRRSFYEKELDLRVSMSYGPGRYDPQYEERGIDYPYAYVPFTEQRNMETFLTLLAERKIQLGPLTSHRFPVAEAEQAYELIKGAQREPYLGVVFVYPPVPNACRRIAVNPVPPKADKSVGVGLLGAGNYARLALLPVLRSMPSVRLVGVSTSHGLSAWDAARRFGFAYAASDTAGITDDGDINLVVIATRHDSHAPLATAALRAGKHVFVEKPLATDETGLREVLAAAAGADRHLMVGFNRRFAPFLKQARASFQQRTQPLSMIYRVNAGAVSSAHWTQDPQEGGGRIVGEVCHFVDVLQFLCGAPPVSVFAWAAHGGGADDDVVSINIRFGDGSIGTVHYFANGDKAVPKEYLEVYGGGKTFILEDFRRARLAENGRVAVWKHWDPDKGQRGELKALIDAVLKGSPTPVPLKEAALTTLATFRILDSLRTGQPQDVGWAGGAPLD